MCTSSSGKKAGCRLVENRATLGSQTRKYVHNRTIDTPAATPRTVIEASPCRCGDGLSSFRCGPFIASS